MAGPGKSTTSINNLPGKLSTGEPQPKPTWVDDFPVKLKTGVRKKSRMANKKNIDLFWPSIILQPPLPPIEAEVHRKVSKATRSTRGTSPGKLKIDLRKTNPEWHTTKTV